MRDSDSESKVETIEEDAVRHSISSLHKRQKLHPVLCASLLVELLPISGEGLLRSINFPGDTVTGPAREKSLRQCNRLTININQSMRPVIIVYRSFVCVCMCVS